jgi:hypothetical protein
MEQYLKARGLNTKSIQDRYKRQTEDGGANKNTCLCDRLLWYRVV